MEEILDLDALLPEAKHIKLNGKVITCNVPSIKNLIDIARLEVEINSLEDISTIIDKIKTVLIPILPEIADDPKFDLTPGQFKNLIEYLKNISIEQRSVPDTYSPKKKAPSARQ